MSPDCLKKFQNSILFFSHHFIFPITSYSFALARFVTKNKSTTVESKERILDFLAMNKDKEKSNELIKEGMPKLPVRSLNSSWQSSQPCEHDITTSKETTLALKSVPNYSISNHRIGDENDGLMQTFSEVKTFSIDFEDIKDDSMENESLGCTDQSVFRDEKILDFPFVHDPGTAQYLQNNLNGSDMSKSTISSKDGDSCQKWWREHTEEKAQQGYSTTSSMDAGEDEEFESPQKKVLKSLGTLPSTPPNSPTASHSQLTSIVTPSGAPLNGLINVQCLHNDDRVSSMSGNKIVTPRRLSKIKALMKIKSLCSSNGPHNIGIFPLEMKPIIRMLLHLDATSKDRVKVRKAFNVVQNCYKRHTNGEKKYRQLTGIIFEALVEVLGQDLGEIVQASQLVNSHQLENMFSPQVPSRASLFRPSLTQFAVAYGAHAMRLLPHIQNFEDLIRSGAQLIESMTEEQKDRLWKELVTIPIFPTR